jgi:hypothetical protein
LRLALGDENHDGLAPHRSRGRFVSAALDVDDESQFAPAGEPRRARLASLRLGVLRATVADAEVMVCPYREARRARAVDVGG